MTLKNYKIMWIYRSFKGSGKGEREREREVHRYMCIIL